MGAPSIIPLNEVVEPGESLDISVDMVAPQSAGTYQGNWKLRNPSHDWFGIGPNGTSQFWVRIVVVQPPTVTPTPTTLTPPTLTPVPPTPTVITPTVPTPTITITPTTQASSLVTLIPAYRLDLDSYQVNSGSGEDLSYETNDDGLHLLTPLGNVLVVVFGESKPGLADCQSASLKDKPIVIENLGQGNYVCYHTNLERYGWAHITNFNTDDYSLSLNIFTWSVP
jgi:hypothetical protein